ncbi:MAG: bifunctional folylpolyglutamate synthase/dihydrofolate synthase, partial [Alphaproteobacteria bacterium]|nr:bifunctional folylpolyglutamate synthase/dihydrofolate synthase [Alphaproteobacteria bacterium]
MPRQAHRQTSEAILARLKRLHPREIDLSLGRIRRLLAALDHPERDLAPVVHVAGTNGKGSVIAFLRAMAESAGLRPNVYTSPHLVRFTERIRPAGRMIGDRALARLLRQCEAANDGAPITFFEITTAAAFLAFARTRA